MCVYIYTRIYILIYVCIYIYSYIYIDLCIYRTGSLSSARKPSNVAVKTNFLGKYPLLGY